MTSEPPAPAASALVVDTNILVRAVLGRRVLDLVIANASRVRFITPESAYEELARHLPAILVRRGIPEPATRRLLDETLHTLPSLVRPIPDETFADQAAMAKARLAGRDENDWPFAALALKLGCPIWTEDTDFFGTGIATWTTNRIEVFFGSQS